MTKNNYINQIGKFAKGITLYVLSFVSIIMFIESFLEWMTVVQ